MDEQLRLLPLHAVAYAKTMGGLVRELPRVRHRPPAHDPVPPVALWVQCCRCRVITEAPVYRHPMAFVTTCCSWPWYRFVPSDYKEPHGPVC